ncbi:MAG: S1C family serine protease, partial [Chthoniobacterales bacterium]
MPLIVGGYAISLASVFFAPLVLGVAAAIVALVLMGTKKTMPGVLLLFFTLLFAGIGIVNTRQAGTGSSNLTSGSIAMDLPTLRAATKPSVVHVIALDSNGEVNATGSGFFVAPFTVVTNHHVVEGASDVLFVLDDGSEVPCDGVVGVDPSRDIAILRSESSGEKFLKVASNAPAEGERVAVIGSPLGLEGTLSEGIVSAVRFNEDRVELIQISAPISPGSSGSPVVDRFGNVVGVATMIFTGGQSINFAVSGVELTHVLDK